MWLSAAAAFVAVCAYYMNFDNQLRGEEEEGRSVLSACPSLLLLYSQGVLLEGMLYANIHVNGRLLIQTLF